MSFLNPINLGRTISTAQHVPPVEEMINESIFGTQQFNGSSALIREYAAAIALTALVTIASLILEPLAGHAAVSSYSIFSWLWSLG